MEETDIIIILGKTNKQTNKQTKKLRDKSAIWNARNDSENNFILFSIGSWSLRTEVS